MTRSLLELMVSAATAMSASYDGIQVTLNFNQLRSSVFETSKMKNGELEVSSPKKKRNFGTCYSSRLRMDGDDGIRERMKTSDISPGLTESEPSSSVTVPYFMLVQLAIQTKVFVFSSFKTVRI